MRRLTRLNECTENILAEQEPSIEDEEITKDIPINKDIPIVKEEFDFPVFYY